MPNHFTEWIDAANERAADAATLVVSRCNSVGSIYLAGFAVECSLKALLQREGRPFPRSGAEGHNLRGLWAMASFRLSDLADKNGHKAFFVGGEWSTALRYETTLDAAHDCAKLVEAARQLSGWIQTQVRRRGTR